jgi:hypothetical protein
MFTSTKYDFRTFVIRTRYAYCKWLKSNFTGKTTRRKSFYRICRLLVLWNLKGRKQASFFYSVFNTFQIQTHFVIQFGENEILLLIWHRQLNANVKDKTGQNSLRDN